MRLKKLLGPLATILSLLLILESTFIFDGVEFVKA